MTNSDLQQLSSDFFQNSLDSSPTSAIMRGHKKYFDQIEELNEETFEKETKAVNDFISRLESIDSESLSNREKVTHGMLEFALSSNKDSLRIGAGSLEQVFQALQAFLLTITNKCLFQIQILLICY